MIQNKLRKNIYIFIKYRKRNNFKPKIIKISKKCTITVQIMKKLNQSMWIQRISKNKTIKNWKTNKSIWESKKKARINIRKTNHN